MNRIRCAAVLVLICCAICVLGSVRLLAQTGVVAWFPPGQEVTNAIALRYKCRVVKNQSPYIMIILGFNRLYGTSTETYLLENNLYADGLRFTNGICTTWPMAGLGVAGHASLRSAIPDYNRHGWTGLRPLSPVMFPKQTYEIDGIRGLTKMDAVSQVDLNGVECQVMVARAGTITDLAGWNCSGWLDTNIVFREWDSMITFERRIYTNQFALPDSGARYLVTNEMFDFIGEFFWRTNEVQAFFWDFELKREGESAWQRVTQFTVYRQDNYPTNYGTRVINDKGNNVIEISNVGGGVDYLNTNDRLDLSSSLPGSRPPPSPKRPVDQALPLPTRPGSSPR